MIKFEIVPVAELQEELKEKHLLYLDGFVLIVRYKNEIIGSHHGNWKKDLRELQNLIERVYCLR